MIVCAHQPNYLPGLNVIEKVESSDSVIWLDDVQYERGGWTNRNQMPDGSWLTVPVDRSTLDGPIREVRISDHDPGWRERHTRTINQHYGHAIYVDIACSMIRAGLRGQPHELLAELNLALLGILLPDREMFVQSNMPMRSYETASISVKLAAMVQGLHGTEYLSGQSGRLYLDEKPFHDRGLRVSYFEPREDRSCVLSRISARAAS